MTISMTMECIISIIIKVGRYVTLRYVTLRYLNERNDMIIIIVTVDA
jgi:hypothetical protein